MKVYNLICLFVGLGIVILLAIMSIADSHATDIVSVIPPSILGASLFVSGYIGLNIQYKNDEK